MSSTEPPHRGRPRRTTTDEQILRASLDLLREEGPAAVNVAAVSARSGVARTTIYRRYADRRALLAATLRPVTHRGLPTEDLSIREMLVWMLARTEEVLDEGIGLGGVAAALADSDPEFSEALRESFEAGLVPIRDQIASDVAAGLLPPGTNPDLIVDLILGAHLAATLRHRPPTDQWRHDTATLLSAMLTSSRPFG